jgi:hypothetical protein
MNWQIWSFREVILLTLLMGFILSAYVMEFGNTTIGCNLGLAEEFVCSKFKGQ